MSPEHRELLELFCRKADYIASTTVFREERVAPGFKVEWNRGGPLTTRQLGPTDEELLPLVTVVRQLYLTGESIYFKRIFNIVYKHLKSSGSTAATVLENAESAMKGFKDVFKSAPIRIELGGRVLGTSDIIDIWFNGHHFHSDPDKAYFYNELWKSPAGQA
ncbi:MAG: hypothetical protein KAU36_05175, partial [candidate division Zixibacteria bacterium]|nr:hypothetical protein [candidate division Zixibacteria bacterium]